MTTKTETTWRAVKLGDVSSLITKGTTPTTTGGKFVSKGINFIKAESISDGGSFIRSKFDHIDEETNKLLRRSVVYENDILYSIAGVIGRSARVTRDILPANTNQALAIVRPNQDVVNPKYLFYILSAPKQRSLANSFVAQSVQANINLRQVSDFEIVLPNIEEQRYIAGILSAFDEKIENNNRIIKTLEEMAQAIFKEWFVHFRFLGHEKVEFVDSSLGKIPKGWEVGKVKDIIEIISGFPFPSKLYHAKRGVGVVTIKNVQDGSFIREFNSFIKKGDLPSKFNHSCFLNEGDILLSLTGNVGRVCFVYGGEYLLNQRVAKLKPRDSNDYAFCYFLFRQKTMQNYLISMGKGSAQSNLSPIEIGASTLLIPTRKILVDFNELVGSIYQQIIQNTVENQKLATMRDLLLPHLMSGEIRL